MGHYFGLGSKPSNGQNRQEETPQNVYMGIIDSTDPVEDIELVVVTAANEEMALETLRKYALSKDTEGEEYNVGLYDFKTGHKIGPATVETPIMREKNDSVDTSLDAKLGTVERASSFLVKKVFEK